MKAPAYQWYPKDALSDERYRLLTYEQRGVYRELLDSQWMEGSIPADPPTLGRLLGIDEKPWLSIWLSVCVFFVETPELPGRLLNLTLDAQRRKKAAYSSSMRDNGKRGGRPRLDSKHESRKPEKSRGFISAKPNESSANCKLQIAIKKNPSLSPLVFPPVLDTPEFQTAWEDWRTYRKQAGFKAYTAIGGKAQLTRIAKFADPVKAVRDSIAQGWQGIFEHKETHSNGNGKHETPRESYERVNRELGISQAYQPSAPSG